MATKARAATVKLHLSAEDLKYYSELRPWLVVSEGEGVQPYETKAEAVAAAKGQASPDLVLGVYRLEHYVSARVLPAQLFDPEPSN